jgi:hypothetical protein
MNATMLQKTPERRAHLNPSDVRVAAPAQARNAHRCGARQTRPEADAEFGCVDWYQYQADEEKLTH